MKPLSGLVVEDEWPARNFLVELLRDTGGFRDIAAVTSVEAARQALARPELAIDVVFVDIRLVDRAGDRSGLDFARSVMLLASPPAVVLATASAEHALDGFELGAVDYQGADPPPLAPASRGWSPARTARSSSSS
jgi:DNA-binding LytR/AlgR family response regulator